MRDAIMKTHGARPRPLAGSFGIPPEMAEARKTYEDKKAAEAQEDMPDGEGLEQEEEEGDGAAEEETPEPVNSNNDLSRLSPRKALAALGVTLTDQDFHSVLY